MVEAGGGEAVVGDIGFANNSLESKKVNYAEKMVEAGKNYLSQIKEKVIAYYGQDIKSEALNASHMGRIAMAMYSVGEDPSSRAMWHKLNASRKETNKGEM